MNEPLSPRLSTARLLLRPFRDSDVKAYAELLRDPTTHPFVVEGGPVAAEEVPARIEALGSSQTSRYWALEFEERFVGYVALHGVAEPTPSLSYAMHPSWRRRGFASEALGALATALGDRALEAQTHLDNQASAKLLLSLGFRDLGSSETPRGPRRTFRRVAGRT
jgi:RimJ/RimL family protein N-acetyltransferase